MKTGKFSTDGAAYIITDPELPRPFDTMLFNDACYSNVHHTGIGCFDYGKDGKEGVQLFSGTGRVCDYDVYGKEHLYSRLIYIRDNENGHFWTLNWEPVCKPAERFSCRHEAAHTVILNQTEGVEASLTVTVPPGNDPVELWKLELSDTEGNPRNLSVFAYFQLQFRFKWGFDSYGNMIYHTTSFDKDNNIFFAEKHPYIRPHNYLKAFFTADEKIVGFDGSRRIFMGQYSTAAAPKAVIQGHCTGSDGSAEDIICALEWQIYLKGNKKEWSVMLGAGDTEEACLSLRRKYIDNVGEWCRKADYERKSILEKTKVKTAYPQLDRIMNTWAKLACLYGAAWCRWGYNGYRDIVQHAMGIADIKPEQTRQILKEAFSYQYSYGMAVRGWNPIDDRPYSDSALWSIYTLDSYIKETGDREFLFEVIPYSDGGEDTVLKHALCALDFLENNKGAHGLLLIKFGDWNDSLTGAGKKGKGESVWLSMAYVYALSKMKKLCKFFGIGDISTELEEREKLMREKLAAAWEGDRYLRCFDDDGRPIGSSSDKYGRLFLETQAFSLIIGMGSKKQQRTLLDVLKKESFTELGYLLLSPAFRELDGRVGRLSAMEPGIAENGTVYTHPNFWLVLGLLKNGYADEAFELIKRLIPGWETEDTKELKEKNLPYQFANCCFGPEHKNSPLQMEYSWVTGSVAWARKAIEEHMLGIRPEYNGLRIAPCLPDGFANYRVEREFRSSKYIIEVKTGFGRKSISVDGKPIHGDLLPVFNGGAHTVEVTV